MMTRLLISTKHASGMLLRCGSRISTYPRYLATNNNQGKKSGSGNTIVASIENQKNLDPPSSVFKEVNTNDVGPGAAKDKPYKNPEYFSYHTMSYADMDIVMENLRCPQPSNVKK